MTKRDAEWIRSQNDDDRINPSSGSQSMAQSSNEGNNNGLYIIQPRHNVFMTRRRREASLGSTRRTIGSAVSQQAFIQSIIREALEIVATFEEDFENECNSDVAVDRQINTSSPKE